MLSMINNNSLENLCAKRFLLRHGFDLQHFVHSIPAGQQVALATRDHTDKARFEPLGVMIIIAILIRREHTQNPLAK